MKKFYRIISLWTVFSIYPSLLIYCQNNINETKVFPQIIVNTEELVYEYEEANNGSHPFWCHGSSILVRSNEDLFMSGVEKIKQYGPSNNFRWLLYKRDKNGWELQQKDETGRTREPCPIGLFGDGRLVMSVNPTLDTAITKVSTKNQPQVLEFSTNNLKAKYKTLIPEWIGSPGFTEHTYRTFSVDRPNNEFILFNNSRIQSHYEWTFLDRTGRWYAGYLSLLKYENDPITVYNEQYMGLVYPSVVVNNRKVYFFGCVAFNKWSRIQNMEDAKRVGMEDIIGAAGGRIAGGRFRRLYYSWTPDITKDGFSPYLEVANSNENGENIRVTDMWVGPDGIAHLLWHQNPVNLRLRDQFWPDIKRVYSMNYAQIKDGKILLKKTLIESGDVEKPTPIEGIEKYSIGWGRFHITPDNRLFMVFYVSGTDKEGGQKSENRLVEIYKDGSVSNSHKIPLENPMSFYFTATPRGGSKPSNTLDLIGQSANDRYKVRYAKIDLVKK